MAIQERAVGDVAVVDVDGRLTHNSRAIMRKAIGTLLSQGHRRFVLNLRGVEYVDSAGLGELVESFTTIRSQGGMLKLLHLNDRVRLPMKLTGLLTFLEVFDAEAEAVASFESAASLEHTSCSLDVATD